MRWRLDRVPRARRPGPAPRTGWSGRFLWDLECEVGNNKTNPIFFFFLNVIIGWGGTDRLPLGTTPTRSRSTPAPTRSALSCKRSSETASSARLPPPPKWPEGLVGGNGIPEGGEGDVSPTPRAQRQVDNNPRGWGKGSNLNRARTFETPRTPQGGGVWRGGCWGVLLLFIEDVTERAGGPPSSWQTIQLRGRSPATRTGAEPPLSGARSPPATGLPSRRNRTPERGATAVPLTQAATRRDAAPPPQRLARRPVQLEPAGPMPLCAALRLDRPPARPAQRTEQPLEHAPRAKKKKKKKKWHIGHLRPFPPHHRLSPISKTAGQVDTSRNAPDPQKVQACFAMARARIGTASRGGQKLQQPLRRFRDAMGEDVNPPSASPPRAPSIGATSGSKRRIPAAIAWCSRALPVPRRSARRPGSGSSKTPRHRHHMGCDPLRPAASSSTGTSWRIAFGPIRAPASAIALLRGLGGRGPRAICSVPPPQGL